MNIVCHFYCLMVFSIGLSLTNASDVECSPGEKKDYMKKKCVPCQNNTYRSTAGKQVFCESCRRCLHGSEMVSKCTPTTDTACRCKSGFTPKIQGREEYCICATGSELKGDKCVECPHGFYTDKNHTICQKWQICKFGIQRQGSRTSDAVCEHSAAEPTTNTVQLAKLPSSTILVDHLISSKATEVSRSDVPIRTSDSTHSTQRPSTSTQALWINTAPYRLVLLCISALLLTGLLFLKSNAARCHHNQTFWLFRKESMCKRPVEETGEKCLSLLV